MKKTNFFMIIILVFLFGCKTVDLETMSSPSIENDNSIQTVEDEKEMHEYLVQEELKIQDVEPTVIYIEKPVYVPYEEKTEVKKVMATY